jgi:nitrate/nitrite transport system substrate-binding protein
MAPLAIAHKKGCFEDEGLLATLEPQANWKALLDRVIVGQIDGAHMLAGQPLATMIGCGAAAHIIMPFSMGLSGNGAAMSNKIWAQMKKNIPHGAGDLPTHPISAAAPEPVADSCRTDGKPFNMGMGFPVSTHEYELHYWLAAGGLKPGHWSPDNVSGQIDAEAPPSVTPPPQIPATMEAGRIHNYCGGEPRSQAAMFKDIGVPAITDHEVWKQTEKIFGILAKFTAKNPKFSLPPPRCWSMRAAVSTIFTTQTGSNIWRFSRAPNTSAQTPR